MRSLSQAALFVFIVFGSSLLSPTRIKAETLSSQQCTPAVIKRIPGQFAAGVGAQVVEINRVVKSSRDGPVCIFEIGISNANNPYASRQQVYLWEVPGPGLVFDTGHWHAPEMAFQVAVSVTRLKGLPLNQVLITHSMQKGNEHFTHLKLFAFQPSNGYQVQLLNVGAKGILEAKEVDGSFIIEAKGSKPGGKVVQLILNFDHQSQSLALQQPTKENVALYRYLTEGAKAFTN